MLNKQKGNMYPFVTHTWNPIRGKCPHQCSYCYMKVFPQADFRFKESELKTELGQGNYIFVGSSTDMWCKEAQTDWIMKILNHCKKFDNRYLFQSKNPVRFLEFKREFPYKTILGCTIESDIYYPVRTVPMPKERMQAMRQIDFAPKMVSIEPIIDFSIDQMVDWMRIISPQFISIGADSQHNHLPEPTVTKIRYLIEELQGFTQVKLKDNLNRLLDE